MEDHRSWSIDGALTPIGSLDRGASEARRRGFAARLAAKRSLVYAVGLLLVTLIPFSAIVVQSVSKGTFPLTEDGEPLGGDLASHLLGGRLALQGDFRTLYDLDAQKAEWDAWLPAATLNPYVSPPFMALVYAPLAALPYTAALLIWTVVSLSLLIVGFRLLWPLLPNLHDIGRGRLFAHLLVAPPAIYVLLGGQDAAVSFALLAGGLRLLLADRAVAAGALLGLGVYKPQLIAVIPIVLLLQRRWSALAAWTAVAGALTALSMLLAGGQGIRDYTALPRSDFYRENVVEGKGWVMQSFVAFARAALPDALHGVAAPLALLVGAVVLVLLLRAGWRASVDPASTTALFATALAAVPLLSPHLFIYDCLVLAIPVLLLANAGVQADRRRWLMAFAYVMLWTTLFRYAAVEDAGWPASLLAAPWSLLAYAGLWWSMMVFLRRETATLRQRRPATV